MLTGFSAPFTPGGRSSLVNPPPWHYAGWLLSVAYELDRSAAGAFLPGGFGTPTGTATMHFADWQATTDGSELVDPAYSQYKESFVVVDAEREGGLVGFCPLIYVDQDASLMRGWLMGLPKKLGSIWLTRSYPIEHPAAAPLAAGTTLGASLAAKDHRLAEARVALTGREGRRLGFLRLPTYGLLGLPTIVRGAPPSAPRLVRLAALATHGTYHEAIGSLDLLPAPRDELAELRPIRVVDAAASYVALTINDVAPAEGD
ncbi:MAG TPA: acetoacetate decarboxylase family protein [Candidatus Limnocylindrales bacterium]